MIKKYVLFTFAYKFNIAVKVACWVMKIFYFTICSFLSIIIIVSSSSSISCQKLSSPVEFHREQFWDP